MDIREIYRLHQQYSHSPVTIDMGTAEDHAAAPALTYAAGGKRRPPLPRRRNLQSPQTKPRRQPSEARRPQRRLQHLSRPRPLHRWLNHSEPPFPQPRWRPASAFLRRRRSKQPRLSPLLGVPSAPHPIKPLLRGPRRHPNQPPRHRAPLHHRHAPRKRIVRPAT